MSEHTPEWEWVGAKTNGKYFEARGLRTVYGSSLIDIEETDSPCPGWEEPETVMAMSTEFSKTLLNAPTMAARIQELEKQRDDHIKLLQEVKDAFCWMYHDEYETNTDEYKALDKVCAALAILEKRLGITQGLGVKKGADDE